MATTNQISINHQTSLYSQNNDENSGNKVGIRKGIAVSQIPTSENIDIDDINREKNKTEQLRGSNMTSKSFIQQRVKQQNNKLSFNEYNQHAKKTKDGLGTTKLAKQYLNSIKNKNSLQRIARKNINRKEVMQHYLALQKLAHALQSSEEDYVALLTENKEHASSLDELARFLQECGEDKEKLFDLLEEGEEFLEGSEELIFNSDSLFNLLKSARYNKNELKEKLKKEQKIPDLNSQEKREFLDQVTTELHILEQEHYSLINGTLNSSSAAQETSDPDKFLNSYSDAIHSSDDLSSQVENLCKHYNIIELIEVLPAKKKALAEDLKSNSRSIDANKLQHIISNMSILHTTHTLLLKVINFSDEMLRIFENKINEKDLLLSIIKLVSSSSVSQTQIENLSLDQKVKEGNPEIYFLTQGIKGIISDFHLKYFENLDDRKFLLTAAQGAIDSAIQRHEENQDQSAFTTSSLFGN